MKVDKYLRNALIQPYATVVPEQDIVISSRIRLARNLRDYRFPAYMTANEREQLIAKLKQVVANLDIAGIGKLDFFLLREIDQLERQALVEKHLFSLNMANSAEAGAFAVNESESLSLLIAEEDHLRIQAILPGLQLKTASIMADSIDDAIAAVIVYAFDENYGYLTCCPTNVGTGIRASVMLHLPALVISKQIRKVIEAASQVGLVFRGIYGEGSEPLGNLFQISNQVTLGMSEHEIIENLQGVVEQVIELERRGRQQLMEQNREKFTDQIGRTYGILANATIMSSKEATARLSDLRFGASLELVGALSPRDVDELFVQIQPGFLQYQVGRALNEQERDIERANIIRGRIRNR